MYGHGGHLGHVTSIMSSDFHFLVLESFHTKFVSVHDLEPRSRNDLDLQYSHIFIQSICLRSLAAIVSENPLFSLFPIEKPKLPNMTLP